MEAYISPNIVPCKSVRPSYMEAYISPNIVPCKSVRPSYMEAYISPNIVPCKSVRPSYMEAYISPNIVPCKSVRPSYMEAYISPNIVPCKSVDKMKTWSRKIRYGVGHLTFLWPAHLSGHVTTQSDRLVSGVVHRCYPLLDGRKQYKWDEQWCSLD